MKFKISNKYFKWGFTAFLVIAASIFFYYLLFHGTNIKSGFKSLMNICMPIVFGLAMAYIMTPVLKYFEKRILTPLCKVCRIKESKRRNRIIRGLGIILTLLLFFVIVYGVISMLVSQIVPSISNILEHFDEYINNCVKWINKLLSDDYPDIGANITKMIDEYSENLEIWLNDIFISKTSQVIKTVSLSVINILKMLWNLLIGLMISVYVLASKERFAGQAKKVIYALFNCDTANIVINNFRFTHRTFIGFLSGKILDSIIIGILCFMGTSMLHTPYASLVSVVIGITNVIPVFGPYLGAIPCIILVFVVNPSTPLNCVYFALFILILQQFDGNVIGPKILGNSTGLAGFWVIFSITLFGGIMGVLGMFIGVPVFAVIYAAFKSFVYVSLRKKNIPVDTKDYINVAVIKDNKFYEYIPDDKLKNKEKEQISFGKEFLFTIDYSKIITSDSDEKNTSSSDKSANSTNQS